VLLRRIDLDLGREELVCHWGPDGEGGRVRAWNPSTQAPRLDDLEIAARLDTHPPEAMALHLALPKLEESAAGALTLLLRGGGGGHTQAPTAHTQAMCGNAHSGQSSGLGSKRRRTPSPPHARLASGYTHATPPSSLPASPSRPSLYTPPTSHRQGGDVVGRGKRRRVPSAKAANA
jgi:hypothetical protein